MSERIFGTVNQGEVEFVRYQPEYFDEFKSVLWSAYYPNECLANGIGLHLPENRLAREEITNYGLKALHEGISIVARVAKTKQIVGHVVNALRVQDRSGAPSEVDLFVNVTSQSPVSKEYMRAMIEMVAVVDLYAANDTDVLMEVMFLGVDPAFTRRSIGLKLVEYSLQLGAELKAGQHQDWLPAEKREAALRLGGATALYASNYSKAIGDRLGFVNHREVFYDQMQFNGKSVQDGIPNASQRSMKLMSVRI